MFGTAGEGYAVDSARFRQVIEAFGDETAKHGITPMVGVIGLSTANVLERLRIAYDLGFREFQFSLPSWAVLSDAEVIRYVEEVCGAFSDAAFLHYNTATTRRLVTGPLYRGAGGSGAEPRRDQDDDRRSRASSRASSARRPS